MQLDRSEIEQREVERYPDKKIADIPSDYLGTVKDYIENDEKGLTILERALSYEEDRRERKDLRLDEVPTAEDLFRIKKRANENMLYERKSRRRMSDERRENVIPLHEIDEIVLQQHSSDELRLRRCHQFMELLDTEYASDSLALKSPAQQKFEEGIGLYLDVDDSEVKGVKYRNEGVMTPKAAWSLEGLASEAAETMRKLEEEPERIGGFGDTTFFNLAKLRGDFLEACGEDIDKAEIIGYGIEDNEEHSRHLMEQSKKALTTLEDIGVTYFEIEGFHTEEIASLVEHLSVRDGFEIEKISTYTDTDMNTEEWREYHEKRIREDTDENNALRLFLDDEDN